MFCHCSRFPFSRIWYSWNRKPCCFSTLTVFPSIYTVTIHWYLSVTWHLNYFSFLFIIVLDRERVKVWGEGQRKKERETSAGSSSAWSLPDAGLEFLTPRSRPEPKSRLGCLTEWANYMPRRLSSFPYRILFHCMGVLLVVYLSFTLWRTT